MIAITGATGQLGKLVIEDLLKHIAADRIIAVVRTPAKASAFAAKGVVVRGGRLFATGNPGQCFERSQ